MGQLTGIQYLDLSNNKLSDLIHQDLVKLQSLLNLNLSFNNLEGENPLDGVSKNTSTVEVKGNNHLCGGDLTTSFTSMSCKEHRENKKERCCT